MESILTLFENSLAITLVKLRIWKSSDSYTGRIVKISNAFVFKGSIKNYFMNFPFVWGAFNIQVTYRSDIEIAKRLVMDSAEKLLSEYSKNLKSKWEEIMERYYLENATLVPTLAMSITDNWVQLNLRYITDYKLRRKTKHYLFQETRLAVLETNDKVKLASTTLKLLKIPPVDIHVNH